MKTFLLSDGLSFGHYFLCLQLVIPSDNWEVYNNRYALWTMSALAFFYLIVPVLYRFVRNYRSAQLVTIVALLLHRPLLHAISDALSFLPETGHAEWFAEMTPVSYVYCFFFGITAYYATKEKKEFILSLIIITLMFYEPTSRYRYELIFELILVLAGTSSNLIQNEKITTHLVNISTKSYAIYLVHLWLIKICNVFYNKFPIFDNAFVKLAVTLICIFAGSYGIYDLVQFCTIKIKREKDGIKAI